MEEIVEKKEKIQVYRLKEEKHNSIVERKIDEKKTQLALETIQQ
jgi:hypothetical protein